MNGVLAKLNPQWFAEIRPVDPSLLKSDRWIFARNRERLLELKSEMEKQQAVVAATNDAAGKMWFASQGKILDAYIEFLRRHEVTFNPRHGDRLLEWIGKNGNPVITISVLEEAYNHLLARGPAEPETPPSITKQPESVTVAPLELATFSVEVSGSNPMEYQWFIATAVSKQSFKEARPEGLQPIPGEEAKRARYQTVATEYSDGALFMVRITNKFGSVMSIAARLTMKK